MKDGDIFYMSQQCEYLKSIDVQRDPDDSRESQHTLDDHALGMVIVHRTPK